MRCFDWALLSLENRVGHFAMSKSEKLYMVDADDICTEARFEHLCWGIRFDSAVFSTFSGG